MCELDLFNYILTFGFLVAVFSTVVYELHVATRCLFYEEPLPALFVLKGIGVLFDISEACEVSGKPR